MSDNILPPGTAVGHYQIVAKLGAGGMGEVYVANDPGLNRRVAIKFLAPHLADSDCFRARFTREAQATAALSHPNIVHIYEVSEYEGRPFFAMELVEGQALAGIIQAGELSFSQIFEGVIQICDGLAEAHEAGIIHRDVKPSNVLVDTKGRVRLVDFGLARRRSDSKLTATGSTVGTLAYMSPEQARGREVDHRSDLFSLGVVLYEMVTGRQPFLGSYDVETLYAINNDDPEPLERYRANVPAGLQEVVSKLLEKDPAMRYQSAAEVATDLRRVLRDRGDTGSRIASRVPSRKSPRGRLVVVVAALVIAALVTTIKLGQFVRNAGDRASGDQSLAVLYFENLKDPADTTRMGQIIQELVITDLSGLPSVNVLSSQRLFDIQKSLGYSDRGKIDREIASEVARRAGADIMLSGNLMQLDAKWIINCHLIDVDNGTIIKSHKIDGTDLYAMVDDISGQVRADMRLPVNSTDRVDVAVKEKTSTSIQAYRHYLSGVDFLNVGSLNLAIEDFKKAIDVDNTFSQAHYKMALAQWWSRDESSQEGRSSIKHILEEGYYSSERERLLAVGALALVERRFTDALAVYLPLAEAYPDDKEVQFVLGLAYSYESVMNVDEALAAFRRVIELDLTFVLAYREIYDIYSGQRDYVKAMDMANDLITIQPDGLMGYRFVVEAALSRGDTAQINLALAQALEHHKTTEELKGLYLHMGLVGNRLRDEVLSEKYTRMALSLDPDTTDWQIMAQLGDALYNQGKTEEARRAWRKGIELNPADSWSLGGLWYVACRQRRYEEAVEYAKQLVKMRPQSPRRYGELYEAYARLLRSQAADEVLEVGLAAIPSLSGKVQLLAHAANLALTVLHDSQKAEQLLLRAAELNPTGSEVTIGIGISIHVGIADIYLGRRDYDRAEYYARKALEIDSDNLPALHKIFYSNLYRGAHLEALEVASRLIERNPLVSLSYDHMIEALIVAGQYAKADSVLEAAVEIDPMAVAKAATLASAAQHYLRKGELERAEQLCRRSCEYAPPSSAVIETLGLIYELTGRYRDAERQYTSLQPMPLEQLRAGREYYPGLLHMAGLCLRQKQYDRAERWLDKALEIDSTETDALRLMAYVFSEREDFARAQDFAQKALDIDGSFFSYALMAWILTIGDVDVDRGLDLARQALQRPPEDDIADDYVLLNPLAPLPHHILGMAYMKKGEFDQAVHHLKIALAQRPNDSRVTSDLEYAKRHSSS